MKIYHLLLTIGLNLCFIFATPPHDVPIAIYTLDMEQGSLKLTVQLDRVDLENALVNEYHQEASEDLATQYFLDHTAWQANRKKLDWQICAIKKDGEHYTLETEWLVLPKRTKTLQIRNTCLVNEISNHSNIIYFNYSGKQRGFRLHKGRLETVIDL